MRGQDQSTIRTPLRQWWRELRIVYFPPFAFFCLIGAITWIWSGHVQPLPSGGTAHLNPDASSIIVGSLELDQHPLPALILEGRRAATDIAGAGAAAIEARVQTDPVSLLWLGPLRCPERIVKGTSLLVEAGAARDIIEGAAARTRVAESELSEAN